jgi:hypothetical protein
VNVKNVGQVNGPIEVNAFKDSSLVETVWLEPGEGTRTAMFKRTDLTNVSIDYSKDIPEMYRNNNNWHSKGLFGKCETLKMEFLFGDNEPAKRELFWTPVIAGNYYDKFMIGAAFHNMGVPFNKFQYLVAPMYSFGRGNVSGVGEFSYTMLPRTAFKLTRLGLSLKSFKMDETTGENRSNGAYLAISPYWHSKLGNRKNSPFKQSFLLQGIIKKDFYDGWSDDYTGAFAKYSFNFDLPDHKLNFNIRTDCIVSTSAEMARVMIESTYKYRYMKNTMKRWVEIRGFIGNTYHYRNLTFSNTEYKEYRFGMSLSGSDGAQDLFFEDYYFGRGQINGIWSQQRDENMGGFKSTSYYGTTSNWMATTNLYFQLPIPKVGIFGLFADAGVFHNGTSVNSVLNTGIGVRIAKVFGLYFPLYMSTELDDSFGNSKYGEKIRFTLKMNIVNKGLSLNSLF